jgi:hypothetical protein
MYVYRSNVIYVKLKQILDRCFYLIYECLLDGVQGTKKREKPKKTWKRSDVEEEEGERRTWREVKWLAANRSRWRSFVGALCSYIGNNRK